MNPSQDISLVEKFDGTNFHMWKFRLGIIFLAKNVWEVVDGTDLRPLADPVAIFKWKQRDGKALATIALNLKDSQVSNISLAQTATEAWDILIDLYENKNIASKLLLRKKFFSFKTQNVIERSSTYFA